MQPRGRRPAVPPHEPSRPCFSSIHAERTSQCHRIAMFLIAVLALGRNAMRKGSVRCRPQRRNRSITNRLPPRTTHCRSSEALSLLLCSPSSLHVAVELTRTALLLPLLVESTRFTTHRSSQSCAAKAGGVEIELPGVVGGFPSIERCPNDPCVMGGWGVGREAT